MEFKGTKGEWKVSKSDGIKVQEGYESKYVVETNELIVCDFIISKGYEKQAKYDAKLIAAAPELLNVCIHALEMCNEKVMPTENDLTIMSGRLKQQINKALK